MTPGERVMLRHERHVDQHESLQAKRAAAVAEQARMAAIIDQDEWESLKAYMGEDFYEEPATERTKT